MELNTDGSPQPRWSLRLSLIAGILLLGILPPAVWWWSVARVPAVDIREALVLFPDGAGGTRLREATPGKLPAVHGARPSRPPGEIPESGAGGPPAVPVALVDVRSVEAFQTRHIDGAVSWPLDAVLNCHSPDKVPEGLRNKQLLVVCEAGVTSAGATRHLRELGLDAWNVEGGTLMWFAATAPRPPGAEAVDPADRDRKGITFRESTPWLQFVAVQGGFTLKPIYMLLSLVLIWVLRRERTVDLVALRWSMVFFFAGEFFCYLNFFLFGYDSHLTEYLHSYGMVL